MVWELKCACDSSLGGGGMQITQAHTASEPAVWVHLMSDNQKHVKLC